QPPPPTPHYTLSLHDALPIFPTVVEVYDDKTYHIIYKIEPAANLILKAIGKEKGSGSPNTSKVGSVTKDQVKQIAEKKMADLNADRKSTRLNSSHVNISYAVF